MLDVSLAGFAASGTGDQMPDQMMDAAEHLPGTSESAAQRLIRAAPAIGMGHFPPKHKQVMAGSESAAALGMRGEGAGEEAASAPAASIPAKTPPLARGEGAGEGVATGADTGEGRLGEQTPKYGCPEFPD